ncbi:hypothetical protein F4780DRAFT_784816 [Xylariomycetidae sp. FL0641]|nr:hypothetical protein F4780DRAFT_784816 [Xylariomycetidae sp. FL0641]
MRVSAFFFLSALAATGSASVVRRIGGAVPEPGLQRRQSEVNTATIPAFSFLPSTTIPVGSGGAGPSSGPVVPAPSTAKPTATAPAGTNAPSSFDFFPSSTVPVPAGATPGSDQRLQQPPNGNGNAGPATTFITTMKLGDFLDTFPTEVPAAGGAAGGAGGGQTGGGGFLDGLLDLFGL